MPKVILRLSQTEIFIRQEFFNGKILYQQTYFTEQKWTDKDCKRHKHSFTDPCIVRLTGNENKHIGTSSYTVLKCEKCNSFTNLKFLSKEPKGLPVLVFEKTHFAITLKDIKFKEYIKCEK